jgi:hypothetical protein
MVTVAPIAVVEGVATGNAISARKRGLAPAASVTKTRNTIAEFAAAASWAEVKVILSTIAPSAPAVNNVSKIPLPSLAAFAAARRANPILGVSTKIGLFEAGMSCYLKL